MSPHSAPTRIVLIRHGETDWNVLGRLQGVSDIPLNATGRAQAERTGQALASLFAGTPALRFNVLYASPLVRATATAELIGAGIGLELKDRITDLHERSFGVAEGLTWDERSARFGAAPVEGQETDDQVRLRVRPALDRLAAAHPGQRIAAVTHGAVVRVLVEELLGAAPYSLDAVRNVSLTTMTHDRGGWELEEYNTVVAETSDDLV